MPQDKLERTVKEFGNGAHVTLPSEWVGGSVEVQLIAPERPEVFSGIETGSELTVKLSNGGTLYGEVEDIKKVEYPDGGLDFEVVCSMNHGTPHDDSRASFSQDISDADGVEMRNITEFELVVTRPLNEPWRNEVIVRYYAYEHVEQVEGVTSRADGVKYTISKDV